MGLSGGSGERYEPRAGDLEGEPDEAFKAPGPPDLQMGRVDTSSSDVPRRTKKKKKKHWWEQTRWWGTS
jgi:hypothetical protein